MKYPNISRPRFSAGLPLARRRLRQLVVLLVTLLIGIGSGLFLRGKVVSVPDGDTVVVFSENAERRRVRLYGIDCPESAQAGGAEATAFTKSLTLFEPVAVSVIDKDRYGRDVALLTLSDGRSLNEELVRQGHAWVYNAHCAMPVCNRWRELEKNAREQRLGLWRDRNPMPPWRWRKLNRDRRAATVSGAE